MAIPTQTTELSAVNLMLASIGERPIVNLDDNQRADVMRALSTLNETNVLVQSRGWWFNEEHDLVHAPNDDGEYILTDDVIKVDPSDASVDNFVKRGKKLYNTTTWTTTGHSTPLALDLVRLLPFDDLPETAKIYIARRAGVIYQTRSVGSPTLFEFTSRDAQEAYGTLQEEELEHVDTNLTHSPGIFDAVWRR
jgi:hypothetical protein